MSSFSTQSSYINKMITKDGETFEYKADDYVSIEFFQTNMQEMYNNSLSKIYLGDQYRGQYTMDYYMRQLNLWMAM